MSGVIADSKIEELAKRGMIYPYFTERVSGKLSNGISSYGYDITLGNEFKVFRRNGMYNDPIDPKNFNPEVLETMVGDVCIIPPNSFVLAYSVESFKIPRDIIGIVIGKSTYARCGLVVNITALEPEWEGQITIEISNTTPIPVKVYAMEGIAQVIFMRGENVCHVSYRDKKGKYQNQTGITLAKGS
jgi:dCTP deaminase